jgi:hypothetical protein
MVEKGRSRHSPPGGCFGKDRLAMTIKVVELEIIYLTAIKQIWRVVTFKVPGIITRFTIDIRIACVLKVFQ